MHKELTDLGLAGHFPHELWPQACVCVCALWLILARARICFYILQANAVRKMATRIATLRKYGQENILIAVDLKEFLPSACADFQAVWMNEQGEELKSEAGRRGRHLDFGWWLLAWDRYALAAAATQQMEFATAMKHKVVMTGVCCGMWARGVARHAWACHVQGLPQTPPPRAWARSSRSCTTNLSGYCACAFCYFPLCGACASFPFQEGVGE